MRQRGRRNRVASGEDDRAGKEKMAESDKIRKARVENKVCIADDWRCAGCVEPALRQQGPGEQ